MQHEKALSTPDRLVTLFILGLFILLSTLILIRDIHASANNNTQVIHDTPAFDPELLEAIATEAGVATSLSSIAISASTTETEEESSSTTESEEESETASEVSSDEPAVKTIVAEVVQMPAPLTFDIQEMLNAHNVVRAKHALPLLSWSETLAEGAQKWSETLKEVDNCMFSHDPDNDYGENTYWAWWTPAPENKLISTPTEVVTWWADEEEYYNYEKNTCKSGELCGHYTQIVWEDTTHVGCGMSVCTDGRKQTNVWVCRYDPAGNHEGERPY